MKPKNGKVLWDEPQCLCDENLAPTSIANEKPHTAARPFTSLGEAQRKTKLRQLGFTTILAQPQKKSTNTVAKTQFLKLSQFPIKLQLIKIRKLRY
jgi:hypothetical protein